MYYVDLTGVLSRLETLITINNSILACSIITSIAVVFVLFRIRSKGGING